MENRECGSSLVPTLSVGMPFVRSAYFKRKNAERSDCIPTRSVGTRENLS